MVRSVYGKCLVVGSLLSIVLAFGMLLANYYSMRCCLSQEAELSKWVVSRGGSVYVRRGKQVGLFHLFKSGDGEFVCGVSLLDQVIADSDIKRLAGFRELRELILTGCSLSDDALWAITQLDALDSLYLAETDLDDEGVSILCHSPGLRLMDFSNTRISDAAMKSLGSHKLLKTVAFDNTSVTELGLECIVESPSLKAVWMQGTRVETAHLDSLRRRRPDITFVSSWDDAVLFQSTAFESGAAKDREELDLFNTPTSLIRLNPQEPPAAGATAAPSVLGETGTGPAEKKSP